MIGRRAWRRRLPGAGILCDLLYPRVCIGCGGEAGDAFRYLCWDCAAGCRPLAEPMCRYCGEAVEGRVDPAFVCAACREHRPAYARARSAVRFDGVLREAVHAFKYRDATWLRDDLAAWMSACAETHYGDTAFDVVVPVPLHRLRQRERGYNQAGLLAACLARRLGIRVDARSLRRVRSTPSQVRLNTSQRRANVRDAFAARPGPRLQDRHVLLVDDVMTTGATVSECARCLVRAGASAVDVLTLARG